MITATHLTKLYGDFAAVDDLSFTIEDGHVYGFLGPNGAGKSTTLNIITGCLAHTSGEVKIDNLDIYENSREAKRKVGYLPEIPPLYVDQTPREYLDFVADAKKVARASKNDEIERVAKETHIEHILDKPIKFLSKGYKQRVGISQALVGDPQIVILDEPTVGLGRQIFGVHYRLDDENCLALFNDEILGYVSRSQVVTLKEDFTKMLLSLNKTEEEE